MNPSEYIFGIALILILLGSAGYFAWRQKRTLKSLADPKMLTPEDRLYVHKQVRRRMLCSVLMVALAGMLIGWFFIGGELTRQAPPPQPVDGQARPDVSVHLITLYVIVALFILFGIILLAITDLMATARFGLRHQRRLENERREMLENQAALLRQRNGNR